MRIFDQFSPNILDFAIVLGTVSNLRDSGVFIFISICDIIMSMKLKNFPIYLGVGCSIFFANFGLAANDDPYDLPQVVAVENRLYSSKYDLSAHLSVMPLDAFYKAVGFGLSYTYSFNSYLSWEMLNAQSASTSDTGLKKDLLEDFQVEPEGILDSLKYLGSTNLIYTPIYAKNLLFNTSVMRSEFSFLGGGGIVGFKSGETAPMFGAGMMMRFFKSDSLSYKFDVRLYNHLGKGKSSELILMVGFAAAFELGSTPTKATADHTNDLPELGALARVD